MVAKKGHSTTQGSADQASEQNQKSFKQLPDVKAFRVEFQVGYLAAKQETSSPKVGDS